MDFDLPEEHRIIRETVREFAATEIEPIAQDLEEAGQFPTDVFESLAELDLMGITVSEEWGGVGGDQLLYSLVTEELGRVSGSIGLSYAAHVSLGTSPIERYGTDAQRDTWLRPLATGDAIGAWALTEPGSGSDASALETTAVPQHGDDGEVESYVLNGTKQFITNANVAGSLLVKATTDPEAGTDGITTFIVDPQADAGVEVTTEWEKMGLNASPTCEVSLTDVRLPVERRLGDEGEGWAQTLETLQGGRISIAALSIGLAQGAYEAAHAYSQEREQFGQPIAEFDAVRNMIVEMYRKIERGRLLTHRAATAYDKGNDVTLESAVAKLDASETAREVAEDAVQVLGGYGYTTDFAPQRFYRDAKLMEIGEGTSEIQQLVIGRELGL